MYTALLSGAFLSLTVTLAVADPLPLSHGALQKVKDAFEKAHIPEALSIKFDPSYLLEVSFPQSSGPPVGFNVGDQVPINSTATTPTFSLNGSHLGKGPFVVAAVDPDAPTPQDPYVASVRHFLGGNFTPLEEDCDGARLVNSTAAVTEWLQPAPPAGSDPHRYIFLVFEQPAGFDSQTLVNASTSILNFNLSSFAEAVGLGDPVAGTFMFVQLNF